MSPAQTKILSIESVRCSSQRRKHRKGKAFTPWYGSAFTRCLKLVRNSQAPPTPVKNKFKLGNVFALHQFVPTGNHKHSQILYAYNNVWLGLLIDSLACGMGLLAHDFLHLARVVVFFLVFARLVGCWALKAYFRKAIPKYGEIKPSNVCIATCVNCAVVKSM